MLLEKLKITNNEYTNFYWKTKIRMTLIIFILLGALNWVGFAFGFNLIQKLAGLVNFPIDKIIYIIIGISVLIIGSSRDTWLPFLSTSLLPDSLIQLKVPPVFDKIVTIKTTPNTKIAYWASSSQIDKADVITAYGDFSNSGVVISNSDGNAELPILTGNRYIVPSGRIIERHIHYRELGLPWGLMSKVKTVNY